MATVGKRKEGKSAEKKPVAEKDSKAAKRRELMMTIDRNWCKRCGVCAHFCPKGALKMEAEGPEWVSPDECIRCRLCEMRCPDLAIGFEAPKKAS